MTRTQKRYGTKSHDRESRHHRHPRSRGGTSHPGNISYVPVIKHQLWHEMFGNMTPEEICDRINSVWIPSNYRFTCKRIL
jgi:hypothetical protein